MRDNDILRGVNEKFMQGWEQLYGNFYPALCAYCENIVRRQDIAEDVVQELLVALWHGSRHFESMPELTFFLYKSCYHNSLNWLRMQKLHSGLLQGMEAPELDETTFANTVREELLRKLHTHIQKLPAQRQRIIMLSLGGHTREEIARELSISPNTVKAQKTSALKSLREALKGSPLIYFL